MGWFAAMRPLDVYHQRQVITDVYDSSDGWRPISNARLSRLLVQPYPQTTTWCLVLVLVAPRCLYHIGPLPLGSGAKIYRLSLQTSIEQSGPTSPPSNKGINPWQCCWTCTIALHLAVREYFSVDTALLTGVVTLPPVSRSPFLNV